MNERKSIWLRRFLLALLLPALALPLIEMLLRLFGVGHDPAFTLPDVMDDVAVYRDNPEFGLICFDPGTVRVAQHFVVPAVRDNHTVRLCVLGDSAAMGDPAPAFGLSSALQVLLEDAYPALNFEIVNCAMTAINSHVVRRMARDIRVLRPDLILVYLGHNEIVGPFGPRSIAGRFTPGATWARAGLFARSTRLGYALTRALRERGTRPTRWGGLEMFLDRRVPASDPALGKVRASLARNLDDILRAGRKAGARVGLCTVASNLKEAPFASQHQVTGMDALEAWRAAWERGEELAAQDRAQEALLQFEAATGIDPGFAGAHFRRGQLLEALGERAKAAGAFMRALNEDALRFRADEEINDILRSRFVAADFAVDVDAAFLERYRNGMEYEELFFDHVHLTPEGAFAVASAMLEGIVHNLPARAAAPAAATPLPRQDVLLRMGVTPWDRLRIGHEMLERRRRPPFAGQLGHAEGIAALHHRLRELASQLDAGTLDTCERTYAEALRRSPGNASLRIRLADFLREQERVEEAESEYRRVLGDMPHHTQAHYGLAQALARSGRYEEALQHFELSSRPLSHARHDACLELGAAMAEAGDAEAAVDLFTRAVEMTPGDALAHSNLGMALGQAGQIDRAVAELERALRLDGDQPDILNQLGVWLAGQGHRAQAAERFRAALEAEPGHPAARANLARVEASPSPEP